MHLRLLLKSMIFKPMTWMAMGLLVTSCASVQEPIQESTNPIDAESLVIAIEANDLNAVKDALEKGAEIEARDKSGLTPLAQAAAMFAADASTSAEIVMLLLEKGADVDAKVFDMTMLMVFAAGASTTPEMITLLLEKGADIDARDELGWTPLMYAARFSTSPKLVTLLLAKGADIEARDRAGRTPLMHAARDSRTPEIVALLLAKGGDPLAKDTDGKKAIDHAEKNENLKGTPAYQQLLIRSKE